MDDSFDAYYEWLGIPPSEQPPNHYRLLGLADFEENENVIDRAANRQLSYLQQCSAGEEMVIAQQMMTEITAARLCLLSPSQKKRYDAKLRAAQEPVSEPEESFSEIDGTYENPFAESTHRRRDSQKRSSRKKSTSQVWKIVMATVGGLFTTMALWFFLSRSDRNPQAEPPLRREVADNQSARRDVAVSQPVENNASSTPKISVSRPSETSFPNSPEKQASPLSPVVSLQGEQAGEQRTLGDSRRGLKLEVCWCPAGTFRMGTSKEKSVNVRLTHGFWMGQHEVTQGMWQEVMNTTPWKGQINVKEGSNYPAVFINHSDAQSFCEKLTQQGHQESWLPKDWQVRLPTEAQWEYACRAGTTTTFSFGNDEQRLHEYGWFHENARKVGEEYAHKVGLKKPNAWNLYDMHGNVWEWCSDWYRETLPGGEDPHVQDTSATRIDRGGSWHTFAENCISSNRGHANIPLNRHATLGFRVVMVPSSPIPSRLEPPTNTIPDQFAGRQAGEQKKLGKLNLEVNWCPTGTFMMGSPASEKGRRGNEDPARVTFTNGFWMGKYEVTHRLWREVMITSDTKGMIAADEELSRPVGHVNHYEAIAFCEKLTQQGHQEGWLPKDWQVRLPTEAQWEYACRAGTTTTFSFGNDEERFGEYGWFRQNVSAGSELQTREVGLKKPNAWGLHDMHGNVWEWCEDWYKTYLPGGQNPMMNEITSSRCCRGGGCWHSELRYFRSATRQMLTPGYRLFDVGFRIALVPIKKSNIAQREVSIEDFSGQQAGEQKTLGSLNLEVNWCPAGTFMMGSPASEKGRKNNERHVRVTLTQGFWMGKHEVTQGLWKQVMRTTPWTITRHVRKHDNYPAVNISREMAKVFCVKLTNRGHSEGWLPSGWRIWLPTEARWEYACRAGTQTAFSFGNDETSLKEYAWFKENAADRGEGYAHEVGRKKPNSWGLYDMHGNVWEWCLDLYAVTIPGGQDPLVVDVKESPVNRGGCFDTRGLACRSALRDKFFARGHGSLGFRFVILPPIKQTALDKGFTGKRTGERKKIRNVNLSLCWCPPGTFKMGSPLEEPNRRRDEAQAQVTLTQGFWMGEYEVTQGLWTEVMKTTPWKGQKWKTFQLHQEGKNYPAVWISYHDAVRFCSVFTRKGHSEGWLPSGWRIWLPTEAQWEYACRAGTQTAFSFGEKDQQLHLYAWYNPNAWDVGQRYAHEVGEKRPNSWGIHDMHGNVWEWCLDQYHPFLPGGINPRVVNYLPNYVNRGGSFNNDPHQCRSAFRRATPPDRQEDVTGFRIVIVPVHASN